MTGVLVPAPTEADWLAARREGITASEIAVVMGLSPFDSPFALYHRKRGDLAAVEDNDAMRIGRHLESLVCKMFAERRPEFHLLGDGRALYAHESRPWQMATPDRIVYESTGYPSVWDAPAAVLEAKTAATYDGWGDDGTDEIPVHYRCQVLWQMDVLGLDAAFVACLFIHSRKLRVYELAMDDSARNDLALLREAGQEFTRQVAGGEEPDVDWRPATGDALRHLNQGVEQRDVTVRPQLARSYRAAVRRYRDAEQRKDLMTNRMLQAIGTGRRALDQAGRPVATRSVYPNRRIDTGKLRESYPDAAAACTVTKDVTKLLPAKGDKS